jgi:hypothetical protein
VGRLLNHSENCQVRKVVGLLTEALSLRFNPEGFCDELFVHRKTLRLPSSRTQAAFLMAG